MERDRNEQEVRKTTDPADDARKGIGENVHSVPESHDGQPGKYKTVNASQHESEKGNSGAERNNASDGPQTEAGRNSSKAGQDSATGKPQADTENGSGKAGQDNATGKPQADAKNGSSRAGQDSATGKPQADAENGSSRAGQGKTAGSSQAGAANPDGEAGGNYFGNAAKPEPGGLGGYGKEEPGNVIHNYDNFGRRGFPVSGFPPEKKKKKKTFGARGTAKKDAFTIKGFDPKKAGIIATVVAVIAVVLILVFSSFYNVDEQHNAVVTQFGKVVRTDTAGLHFKIPLIQKVSMVDMTTHGVGIGYSDDSDDYGMYYNDYVDMEAPVSSAYYSANSVMITSDFNLLDIDFYLEYKVSDPVSYLYNSLAPEEILKNMAFAAIRSTVVNYTVDEAMTTGKSQIQAEIKEKLQQWLLDENIGMQVVNVQIQDAQPPTEEIQRAFKEVENAKQSKDTALNNARQYRNEQVPKAEAEADRIRQNAEATKASRIAEAEGQASRFNTMFEQYKANPLITRQRLFYEAMEDVLPGKKVIFTDGSTQELLPIDSFGNFSSPAGGGTNE